MISKGRNVELVEGRLEETAAQALVTVLPVTLEWKGTLNQALLKAAGPALDEFLREEIHTPRVGDVLALPGVALSARYLIATLTPRWGDPMDLEDRHLLQAWRKPMELAEKMALTDLAFGALGTGQRAFPLPRAARLAARAINERWYEGLTRFRIICPRQEVLEAYRTALAQDFTVRGPVAAPCE